VQRAYLNSTRALSAVILVLGLVMIVSALAHGGGPFALGVVLGAMLALLGVGRLWLARNKR
jgi:1,4-dihydroxy-2-naphthoate octaprenyltransferase